MTPIRFPLLLAAALAAPLVHAADAPAPDLAAATAAVTRYLADHGDFCLGKMDWPVDLSARDLRARGRDVLQMPVLERLGLVSGADATAMRVEGADVDDGATPQPVAVHRYQLTPLGEQWMREREILVAGPDGDRLVRRRDLCAAHLGLDAVVDWRKSDTADRWVATYTYVATPAPWSADPAFRQAFPMAARVLTGSREMQLKQAFRREGERWVPDGLSD